MGFDPLKHFLDPHKIGFCKIIGAFFVKFTSISRLEKSLKRLRTDYIDLLFVHGIRGIKEMDAGLQSWSQAMKKAGKIRLFGFSTHSNMEDCLERAAKLPSIEGIMFIARIAEERIPLKQGLKPAKVIHINNMPKLTPPFEFTFGDIQEMVFSI
jgi:hypothetical protein